jgi:hypothetical protein
MISSSLELLLLVAGLCDLSLALSLSLSLSLFLSVFLSLSIFFSSYFLYVSFTPFSTAI